MDGYRHGAGAAVDLELPWSRSGSFRDGILTMAFVYDEHLENLGEDGASFSGLHATLEYALKVLGYTRRAPFDLAVGFGIAAERFASREGQETADPEARLAQKYRLRHAPVVDDDMRLLGVVTLQDIIEVIQHEASEDMMKLAGVGMVDSLHTPLRVRYRMRLPWLYLTLGGELFIALVLSRVFRATLERASILAAFMPAIMATGGNLGLQSTTMVIRGLGMGTLHRGQFLRVLAKEFRLGLLLGVSCGAAASGVAVALEWGHAEVLKLGVAVFVAMVSATAATSLVGTVEPLVLHRLGRDPATACGPFVTMFNDLFGTTVYFLIATLLGFSAAGAA